MECMVRDVNVYYEIHGQGTPIVIMHGWSPDHRMMKGCLEPVFRDIGTAWQRIYFDLPGMGKTKSKPWITNTDHVLDVVLGFVDAVIPGQRFVLVGESYGGYLARGLLLKRPSMVDGLLLLCSIGRDTPEGNGGRFQVLEKDDALLAGLTEEDRSSFQRDGLNATQNRRVWERFRDEIIPGLKAADYAFLKNLDGRFSFDLDALEKPFDKPALILACRQDTRVGFRGLYALAEMFPRASFVLLDKAAHNLQIEQDVLFTATVSEWLERVAAEAAR